MTTDEASRHHLYEMARSALDDAAADTLMAALPRDPDRFATKDDLTVLEANLLGEIKTANGDLLRTLFFGVIGTNATLVALVVAAVRLA